MSDKKLRIVYMGTPAFAVAGLEALHQAGYQIVGVVTAPDRPAGRGMKVQASAVKQAATVIGCPILQPIKLKDPRFLSQLSELKADLFVVVAFRMLPEVVWAMPPLGCFNLHASLLPQYRGAAPINWAVINGEHETGVTTFQIQQGMDTGGILLQEKIAITEEDTAGTIHDKLMPLGAKTILATVDGINNRTLTPKPQKEQENLKKAPKIFRETGKISFENSAKQIHNLVRGLSPYPGAWLAFEDKIWKVFRTEIIPDSTLSEGSFDTDYKTYIRFGTSEEAISLLEIQLPGKKRMDIQSFLRGNPFSAENP